MSYTFSQFLAISSCHSPTFSYNGRKLAFTYNVCGIPQAYVVPQEGGWPNPIGSDDLRVHSCHYSPRHDRLIVVGDRNGNERTSFYLWENGSLRPLTHQDSSIHRFGAWSPDGRQYGYTSNVRNGVDFDLYLGNFIDDENNKLETLQGDWRLTDWSKDNLLLLHQIVLPHQQRLAIYDLNQKSLTFLTEKSQEGRFLQPKFTSEGNQILVGTDSLSHEYMELYQFSLETKEWLPIKTNKLDVEYCLPSPTDHAFFYSENINGYSQIQLVTKNYPDGVSLPLPPGVLHSASWSPDGSRLAVALSSPTTTNNIWIVRTTDLANWPVTSAATWGVSESKLHTPEILSLPSFDGTTIHLLDYMPKKYQANPTIVLVHGGPAAQERPRFSAVIQYFVSKGYRVIAPNVRGSTGYGLFYEHLDDVEKRPHAVADLQTVWNYAVATGSNAQSIAIMGGSYGGYMVLAALTSQPDLWQCGVNLVGIVNFETFLENTGPWRRHLREAEYGSLAHDRALLAAISPIHHLEKMRAPLLILHGENDPRVPISEAKQLITALERKKHPVEYLFFADEGHGIVRRANRIVAYETIERFLEQHLKKDDKTE